METRTEMRVTLEELRGMVDYFSEINVGKRTIRTGWRFAGEPPLTEEEKAKERDTVGGHVYAGAHILFVLGMMGGMKMPDLPQCKECIFRCLGPFIFHDDHEIRTGERDKLATHYQEIPQEVISKAMADQTCRLPKEIGQKIYELAMEANFGEGIQTVMGHDADILEPSTHAKLSHEKGFRISDYLLKLYLDADRVETIWAKRLMNALRIRKDLATSWLRGALNV